MELEPLARDPQGFEPSEMAPSKPQGLLLPWASSRALLLVTQDHEFANAVGEIYPSTLKTSPHPQGHNHPNNVPRIIFYKFKPMNFRFLSSFNPVSLKPFAPGEPQGRRGWGQRKCQDSFSSLSGKSRGSPVASRDLSALYRGARWPWRVAPGRK